MAVTKSSAAAAKPEYLIVNRKQGRKRDLFKYVVWKDVKCGMKFMDSSDEKVKADVAQFQRQIVVFHLIVCWFIALIDKPLKYFGYVVDFFLNLISQNHGFLGILGNILRGKLKIPKDREAGNFISAIGHLDGRIDLYKSKLLSEKLDFSTAVDESNIKAGRGNRIIMDLCVIASKLVYENKKVIQTVVNQCWKMHFVDYYECWNEHQKESNAQVFICCDKPKDANLILVSFRGTEPFRAQGWETDFNYFWYDYGKVGKIHIGFLEALGLGHRGDLAKLQANLQTKNTSFFKRLGDSEGLDNMGAYDVVGLKVSSLLNENKNAKFVITGYSSGGALAILFSSLLVIHKETQMLERLLKVYTFGQPRIGDRTFAKSMESHLNFPVPRYFRVVYSNDIVTRVPLAFAFKHFGTCVYYDSNYVGKLVNEEPTKNFFSLGHRVTMHLNAVWEFFRSFTVSFIHGPEYKETWLCKYLRIMALVFPGIASHSIVDYINAVRLGRERAPSLISLKSLAKQLSEDGLLEDSR